MTRRQDLERLYRALDMLQDRLAVLVSCASRAASLPFPGGVCISFSNLASTAANRMYRGLYALERTRCLLDRGRRSGIVLHNIEGHLVDRSPVAEIIVA